MSLRIPFILERLIAEGRWPSTQAEERRQNLTSLVPPETVAGFARGEKHLYLFAPPFRTVASCLPDEREFWDSEILAPEGIDRELAIVIGDFGLGSDAPIVLDYREGSPPPRVLRLRWWPDAPNEWVEVAPSFEAFVALLGI